MPPQQSENINDSIKLKNVEEELPKQMPLMRRVISTKVLKKNASEDLFRNMENILQKEGEFYIRVVAPPPNEEIKNPDEAEEKLGIQKCCICFDNFGDAVLMDCGHGGCQITKIVYLISFILFYL